MVMAAGMAMTIPSMTGSIMSAVPMGKAGVGSAMNDTTRELGGALGVAVLGSLVASRYDARLSPALDLLPASLRGQGRREPGRRTAARHPSVGWRDGEQVADIAREAFVSGMHLAAIIAGCVALLAAGIVYRKLPAGNPHAKGAASLTRAVSRLRRRGTESAVAGTETGAYGPFRCLRLGTPGVDVHEVTSLRGDEDEGGGGRNPGVEDGGDDGPADAELDRAAPDSDARTWPGKNR